MGPELSDSDNRSKTRRPSVHEDHEASSSQKRKCRDDEVEDRPRRRHKSRSTSRRREKRDKSRSPDSTRRRDRDHEERRHKHRHRHMSRSRSRDGHRSTPRDTSPSRRRHRSSRSPESSSRRHRHRHHSRSRSPQEAIDYDSARQSSDAQRSHRRKHSPSPPKHSAIRSRAPLPSQDAALAIASGQEPVPEKELPNFKPTGALAAAANAVTTSSGETVTLKYHEPPEARKPPPRDKWKLFVFKGDAVIDTIELSARSCWLVGRDRAVVDFPAEHPSVSKQHAVIQFRYTEKRNEYGDKIGRVKPYLIDLESANGTVLNGEKVPESRYLEVRDRDVLRFGLSEREYVVMLDRD